MRVLNLYAGLGGNRALWDDVEVTAVDNFAPVLDVYRSRHPEDTVIEGDAHQYLLDHYSEFDFIWSSPPCQTHSKMAKATRHKTKRYPDMSLYQQVIFLDHFFKGKWVVENVKPYYDFLIQPTKILGRHCFWTNFKIYDFEITNHENFIRADSPAEIQSLKDWLGIQYEGNIYYKGNHSPGQVLRNCVHPLLGEHVMKCANLNLKHL